MRCALACWQHKYRLVGCFYAVRKHIRQVDSWKGLRGVPYLVNRGGCLRLRLFSTFTSETRARILTPNPCECAEERSFKRIRSSDCLSAASSSSTPLEASTARCPQRSGGTQTPGSPFLLLTLLLAKQKKSESPAAATERLRNSSKNPVLKSRAKQFGIGRFGGQSPNSPILRLALRVLRFATQRNCDPTPKTRRLAPYNSLSNVDLTSSNPISITFQASSLGMSCATRYVIHSSPRNRSTILRAYRLATSPTNFGKSTCALSSARSEIVRTDANGKP